MTYIHSIFVSPSLSCQPLRLISRKKGRGREEETFPLHIQRSWTLSLSLSVFFFKRLLFMGGGNLWQQSRLHNSMDFKMQNEEEMLDSRLLITDLSI